MAGVSFRFVLGLIAGALAWAMWEPAYPKNPGAQNSVELYMVLTAGALIGLAVAGLGGFLQGSRAHALRAGFLGLLFGTIGISLGYTLGGNITRAVFGSAVFLDPTANILTQILARTTAIAPMAIFLGAAVGASTLNLKRTIQGTIGGAIAGVVAGLSFDILSATISSPTLALQGQQTGDVGGTARALTFSLIGALIGLFIGLVDLLARKAWVRLSLGRNEGREWSLDWADNYIGRNENATIPLFGDPNIAPVHAVIHRQGNQYILRDGGSPMGTGLNGQRIQEAVLFPGAIIHIGNFSLEFLEKGSASRRAVQPMPAQVQTQTPTQMPTQMYGQQPIQQQSQMPNLNKTVAYGQQNPLVTAPAVLSLVVLDGPLSGQRFPLLSPIELGRESAQVPMQYDSQASRRHAVVSPYPSGVEVRDNSSTNGTFVNGQRISQTIARPGDVVKVGSTSFRIE
jgi:pSer/pThr/pTyr-binding forkhead associated (FHA) protein